MKLTFILFSFLFLSQRTHADEMEGLMKSLDSLPETGTVIPDCFPEDPFDSVITLTPILPKKEEGPRPYLQARPRGNTCTRKQFSSTQTGEDAGFRTISHFPCNGKGESFYSGVFIAGNDYHDVDFFSQDGSKAGSYIYLTEAVLPQDSYNVKSMVFLLPRKGIPEAITIGDEIHVTLQTGEVVIYDRSTKKIKSGALTEGPSDPSKDRFTRRPPNIHYSGKGISIRVDHRYEHPTSAAGDPIAEVKQNGRSCNVPREKLWDKTGEMLELDDSKLVQLLNQVCPPQKGERPFSI